ncbi:hypothetical protein [Luteimonas kalidii]|uniref:DUF3303 domain-containing protein n=1 Tax=Luteimonas kalidii TaxID=3042025 RepID=A0ABT6JXG5_9GAMM|nr:hypothetical protein [Luteimonas kalidii]MDH5834841.1 hypothetical protein [Luteimonas kalidii]
MQMTFLGGPWDGASRPCPATLPDRIEGPGLTIYVRWRDHPAVGGLLADPSPDTYTFAAVALGPRELLDRAEDLQDRVDRAASALADSGEGPD